MIVMGIDAAHRNTGVCIMEVMDTGERWLIKRLLTYHTYTTVPRANTIQELEDIRRIVNGINRDKALYTVWQSACEIAHSGKNFKSSRNVGITWGLAIGTNSTAYTQHEVRAMFKDRSKAHAKDKALKWLIGHNFSISHEVARMNDHEVDAACVAMLHLTKVKPTFL
jgi:Holliday junction resolvasome RuvABC endonuclease subunit